MNLRTNVRIKIEKIKNKVVIHRRTITVRYHTIDKRFLLTTARFYLKKIVFDGNLKVRITVFYNRIVGESNEGTYTTHHELMDAFESFMEQDLIKDFWDGVIIPKRPLTDGHLEVLKRMRIKKGSNVPTPTTKVIKH